MSQVGDRLRLMFMCCHPVLEPAARVALTLRLVAGLSMAEVARAFLVPERTMAQRLTRAKRKLKQERVEFSVPYAEDLPARVGAVCAVIYLIFNEGYVPSTGEASRDELSAEAIRLGRMLNDLLPAELEVRGLLALMVLTQARRAARFAGDRIIPLAEQDRTGWDAELIAEGHALVRTCLAAGRPGPYQIQAAINAVHTDGAETDWRQVLDLYDLWLRVAPTPVVRLNRAVALAEVAGPETAPGIVDDLALTDYQPWQVARGHLLGQLGRMQESRAAYRLALELTDSPAERAYLETVISR